MPHSTNNKAVVTHIYPKMSFVPNEPPQKPISDEREGDVWYELRELTFEEEPGFIYVLTHDLSRAGEKCFEDHLNKGDVKDRDGKLVERCCGMREVLYASPYHVRRGYKNEKGEFVSDPITGKPIAKNLSSKWCAEQIIRKFKEYNPIATLVLWQPEEWQLEYLNKVVNECPGLPIYIFHTYHCDKYGVEREAGRKEDYTFSTLPEDEEEDVLEHLLAKFALTMMTAPSYAGKTHNAISMGLSLVTGEAWLGQFKVPEKMRVRYFVPELTAGRFKKFMQRIAPPEVWKQHEEDFIVRPLDCDLLMLDSPEMIEKCRGCYVFLDTLGYFMGLDDNNSYAAAIEFAKRINHLIKEGCLGVCGLYHPPKYSKLKKETGNILTLENQILGSAGFGGLLRSCIAIRNLNQDANEGLWCYVQGLKNPGLGKPFQVKGFPMEYLGESPYLSELLGSVSKTDRIEVMLSEGKTQKEICKTLGVSATTVTKRKKQMTLDEVPADEVFHTEEED